ncbi:MAG TPA: glycoside hydrolase family 97 catalytic domain-containing protein, partial [Marinagarivorans sp.]|nr:glycoside hydrolase family 97 catalytic domain-containing protein [Marinagarivorans sp.]
MKKFFLFNLLLLCLCACAQHQTPATQFKARADQATPVTALGSPDGSIQVELVLSSEGRLSYSIRRHGQMVVLSSGLGLVLHHNEFVEGLSLVQIADIQPLQESYLLKHGKKHAVNNAANERVVRLRNKENNTLEVIFRVFNDGIGFKYRALAHGGAPQHFLTELSQFTLPADAKAWLQPIAPAQTGYANTNPSYEEYYQMDIAADGAPVSAAGWAFPALFRSGDTWLAITEAGMDGHFHASRLQTDATSPGRYLIGQPSAPEVFTGGALLAPDAPIIETPWRIIAMGSLKNLVESTLGTDFALPAKANMDFVQPGVVAWSWALLKDEGTRYNTQRAFIDYAARMHWPYVLIDALWDSQIGKLQMAQLAQYAASKGVGLILWYNSSGAWNTTPQTPKNILIDRSRRLEEFAWLQRIGIKGLKVDFFAGDGQSMLAYYTQLAEDAAQFNLMLNYHGATLPRGLQRTYPNILTMEAVKGLEFITFSQAAADAAPSHMAMLPFARNLFDPMDFTPTVLSSIPGINRRTRVGFELAVSVLFLSGWQHIAETPAGMAKVPHYVKNILRDLPVSWDETRFVDGFPGRYAVIARRKGNQWYVAAING